MENESFMTKLLILSFEAAGNARPHGDGSWRAKVPDYRKYRRHASFGRMCRTGLADGRNGGAGEQGG
jgi:hypothetical protein